MKNEDKNTAALQECADQKADRNADKNINKETKRNKNADQTPDKKQWRNLNTVSLNKAAAAAEGEEQERWWEWLCSIPGVYQSHREILLRCFCVPKEIYCASERSLHALGENGGTWVEAVLNAQKHPIRSGTSAEFGDSNSIRNQNGIHFVSCQSEKYPFRLSQIEHAPHGLFYKGTLPNPEQKAVAIVGARVCTPYGKRMAERIAEQTANAGGIVISGGAHGVDGAAQWKALECGGKSYAILGCGVDIRYPKSNQQLFERLEERGGILSEFPPGTPPHRSHFPMRNRIISGLSDVVAVTEARCRSGSLITADFALDQGKTVMAVPGRLDDELSRGCNELIAQGAGVILSAESFAEQIFPDLKKKKLGGMEDIMLSIPEKLVYSSLDLHSKSIWELMESTSLPIDVLMKSLLELERKGLAKETERNYYVR